MSREKAKVTLGWGVLTVLIFVGMLIWKAPDTEAQSRADFRGISRAMTAQTATGQTTGVTLGGIAQNHTIYLIVTGGPAGCTYRLQGSRDGTNWFNISAADITCTSSVATFYANSPTQYVRGNLLTLSGGTTPTVTMHYIGR